MSKTRTEIVAAWEKAEREDAERSAAYENRTPEEVEADMQHAALAQAERELALVKEWNPHRLF